jgi:Tfp pilus assembly protein PilX
MSLRIYSPKGSVVLVVLCFVAVLGIALASYIALSSRAMTLSNRAAQNSLSKQLAEMGLEEALRAFNANNWATWTNNGTTATWSTSGTTASCTITFPASKFAQGAVGTVKIRVDNYNSAQLSSTWANGISYRPSDTVNYGGMWYRCVRATSSQTPNGFSNMFYWVPVPVASFWDSTLTYKEQDVVFYATDNRWYRCILAPTANQVPTNTTYWTNIPRITQDSGYTNTNIEVLMFFGQWYYWNSGWYTMPSPNTPIVSWVWRSGYNYSFNDLVFFGSTPVWYRCIAPHTSSGTIGPTNTTYWEPALTTSWAWSSSYNYNVNDVVYRSGSFYRCLVAHINQVPPNATYWSTAPLRPNDWDSGRQYSVNDTVRYNGLWYRCVTANNGSNPASSANWSSTANSLWSASTTYNTSSYVSYGGVWYDCIVAPTANQSPNNATYWTALGATVVYAEGQVSLSDGSAAIKTQVRATLAPAPLFPNAVGATSTLTINGGGVVDSYDSSLGNYNVSGNLGYSAVLAASGTTNPAVTVTSTTVKGYVAAPSSSTNPYAPMWTYGGSAVLTGSGSSGMDLTRVSRSPNIPQFDCLPTGGLSTAMSSGNFFKGTLIPVPTVADTTLNLGTPGAAVPSVYYYNGGLEMRSGSTSDYATININGPVILYINGYLRTNTGGTLIINNTGSAEIHFATTLRSYAGSGGFINRTKDPKKLSLIGDGTTSNACYLYPFATDSVNGDNWFYGTIYMPNLTTSGGITIYTGVTICGAISAKNVTFDAEATIHYDTSLRYKTISGVAQPRAIVEWRELTDVSERVTLP